MSDHTLILFNVFEDWSKESVTAVHKLYAWNTDCDCPIIINMVTDLVRI